MAGEETSDVGNPRHEIPLEASRVQEEYFGPIGQPVEVRDQRLLPLLLSLERRQKWLQGLPKLDGLHQVLLPGLKEGEFLLDGRPASQLLFVIRAQAGERLAHSRLNDLSV